MGLREESERKANIHAGKKHAKAKKPKWQEGNSRARKSRQKKELKPALESQTEAHEGSPEGQNGR